MCIRDSGIGDGMRIVVYDGLGWQVGVLAAALATPLLLPSILSLIHISEPTRL